MEVERMSRGIKHKDVGNILTKEEWLAVDRHELESGPNFPISPSEGDIFYKSNEHRCYIFDGTEWRQLSSEYLIQEMVPSNPRAGQIWFDIVNKELKIFIENEE